MKKTHTQQNKRKHAKYIKRNAEEKNTKQPSHSPVTVNNGAAFNYIQLSSFVAFLMFLSVSNQLELHTH